LTRALAPAQSRVGALALVAIGGRTGPRAGPVLSACNDRCAANTHDMIGRSALPGTDTDTGGVSDPVDTVGATFVDARRGRSRLIPAIDP